MNKDNNYQDSYQSNENSNDTISIAQNELFKDQAIEQKPINNYPKDIVQIVGYLKRFNKKEKVGEINLNIKEGICTLIVGQSGSGKSVLVNSIMGTLVRYKGKIIIDGKARKTFNGWNVNKDIGFYQQMEFTSYYMTLYNFLKQIRPVMGLKKEAGLKRIEELLEFFDMAQFKNKKISDFSWGMKNRLNMIISLMKDPKIIILDEPGANLDSLWRRRIIETLMAYKKLGKTVILVVHNIDEVIDIADEIVVVETGKLIYKNEIKNINLFFKTKIFFKTIVKDHEQYGEFKNLLLKSGFLIFKEDFEKNTLEIGTLREEKDKINFLLVWLIKCNIFVKDIINLKMDFESIFSSLQISKNFKEGFFYFKEMRKNADKNLLKIYKKIAIKNNYNGIEANEKQAIEYLNQKIRRKILVNEINEAIVNIRLYKDKRFIDYNKVNEMARVFLKEEFLKKAEFDIMQILIDIHGFKNQDDILKIDDNKLVKIEKQIEKIKNKNLFVKNFAIKKKIIEQNNILLNNANKII